MVQETGPIPKAAGGYGSVPSTARQQLEILAVYDGYLARQQDEADRARELEELGIPCEFSYEELSGLSYESVEKLTRVRPATVGQATS